MTPQPSELLGEFGEDDCIVLQKLVQLVTRPGVVIVEIGSWLGNGSTRVFIDALRSVADVKLYCVDTWAGSTNVEHHRDVVDRYDVFEIFLKNIQLAGGSPFVHPLRMSSREAANVIADGSADLVFIDGNHAYPDTVEDIALWRSKLRPGGILCGHDCECRPSGRLRDAIYASLSRDSIPGVGTEFLAIHPGVVAAVDEAFGGAANLWAEFPFRKSEGRIGRATIWDNRAWSPGERNQLLEFVEVKPVPKLVGEYSRHNVIAYADHHYVVPHILGPLDFSVLDLSGISPSIVICDSRDAAERVVAQLEQTEKTAAIATESGRFGSGKGSSGKVVPGILSAITVRLWRRIGGKETEQ